MEILVIERRSGGFLVLLDPAVPPKSFENVEQLHSWLGRHEARRASTGEGWGGFWKIPSSVEVKIA